MAAPPKLQDEIWTAEKLAKLPRSVQAHSNILHNLRGRPNLIGKEKIKNKTIAKINDEILKIQNKKFKEQQKAPTLALVAQPEPAPPLVQATTGSISSLSDFIYQDIDTWDDVLREDIKKPIDLDWIEKRDQAYGLYPNVSDPNFAARLARKTEFYELRSEPVAEDSCQKAAGIFSTTSIQRLVARFLHPDTPYNGALLYHGVGVGKTCSAITVAETFLETMPYNKVFIIAPQAIADGFRRTIFDINRLVKTTKEEEDLTKDYWKSPQCTGMTYLRLADMAKNPNKEEIAKEVDKLVKKRYQIMGYLRFANWVNDYLKEIPDSIIGKDREDRVKQKISELFADHLLIIDEAHNLRDADPGEEAIGDEVIAEGGEGIPDETKRGRLTERAEGKRLTPILQEILRLADGLRVMLMTATPMYNTAPEIVFLLNLLTLNDTKDDSLRLEISQVFNADGKFKEGGDKKLADRIKRYVSYMRGENPNTFPLRLTPPESNITELINTDKYPIYSIARKEMKKGKKELVGHVHWSGKDKEIMKRLPLVVHNIKDSWVGQNLLGFLTKNHEQSVNEANRGTEVSDFILDRTMQMGNIFYKNGTYGRDGWRNYFKEIVTTIRSIKVKQYSWIYTDEVSVEDIFGPENLANYAPKIAAIVDLVERGEGISFVYSRYIPAGALPIAIALELRGWVRVLADGTPAPLLLTTGIPPKNAKNYILLTSDDALSPNFPGLVRYATSFKNLEEAGGSKVRAIIGSQVASEGLDLKCIRQIHLLDGWYHLNRIEQIEGRGVRFCSHIELPLKERNCLIYLHAVNVGEYETADLYAYRLAVRKAQPIGEVSRLMKVNAWDCYLNIKAITLEGTKSRESEDALGNTKLVPLRDEPFTSLCDFKGDPVYNEDGDIVSYECKPYTCGSNKLNDGSENISTQKTFDFRRKFLEIQQRVINSFKENETVVEVDRILQLFYNNIPESFARIGLREILNNVRIFRKDGIYGTLRLVNNYVVFQPEGVTDTMIPMALRYGRAYGRMPHEFNPPRGSLLSIKDLNLNKPLFSDESISNKSVPIDTESEIGVARIALNKLKHWDENLNLIIKGRLTGKIENLEVSAGWRWVFRYFRNLPDVKAIAYHWFMENFWTNDELIAVFTYWLTKGIDNLRGYELECAKMFMKENHRIELFQKDKINRLSGFVVYNINAGATGTLQSYCQYGGSVSQCTAVFKEDINSILGKVIDRKEDTGPYFGFLVYKQKTVIFKSVDKIKGDLRGAECANTPNLGNHQQRIRAIQKILTDAKDPISNYLLPDAELTKVEIDGQKTRQGILTTQFENKDSVFRIDSKDPLINIADLTLKQICPYMEFLLRYTDRRAINRKRWFLSVVDSARAGVKMS